MSSIPGLNEFDPTLIPMQHQVISLIRNFDYTKYGPLELLLSGSVGSAKSLLLAHIAVTHCLLFRKAKCLIGRLTLPDLKETLFSIIIEHLEESNLIEGVHYKINHQSNKIKFYNGSEIFCKSWVEKKVKKFRSLQISCAIIEELTENDDKSFYSEIIQRIGRLKHIKETFIISATNPDSPTHWVYKNFEIEQNGPDKVYKESESKRVFYSKTEDNPFLPPTYVQMLKEKLDARMIKRMLYGEWLDIASENIYYNYLNERNFKKEKYKFNEKYPIDIFFDFNIGVGKPMSCGCGQFIDGKFHVAKDYIVHGARTHDILEEMASDKLFENKNTFRVYGDCNGRSNGTRSVQSDYDIIFSYLKRYIRKDGTRLTIEDNVPNSNPPIRERHNLANGAFCNDNKEVRFFVYEEAKRTDEGFRNTKPKKGSYFNEDDSFEFQHITTAVTYWLHYITSFGNNKLKIRIN